MTRPSQAPAYDLSDADERDLIAPIQAGKPLPRMWCPRSLRRKWTGGYHFENEWQSFRTRKSRDLELVSVTHVYDRPGRYTVAVKVIDIFGNDTMTLVHVTVG